jgi:hypothetical protein
MAAPVSHYPQLTVGEVPAGVLSAPGADSSGIPDVPPLPNSRLNAGTTSRSHSVGKTRAPRVVGSMAHDVPPMPPVSWWRVATGW